MKRLTLALAVGLLFLSSISCGGGGGTTLPPANRDLSGLEGNWLIVLNYTATAKDSDGESYNFSDSSSGYWMISQNAIVGSEPLVWSYNGSLLTINNSVLVQDWDSDCGDMNISFVG